MQTSLIGKVLVPVTIFVFLLSCTPPAQPTPPSPVTSTLPSTEPILQPPAPSAPPVVLPSPTLDIIAPEASSNVTAGTVSINIRVTGFTLKEPGGVNADGQGHIHYYLDVDIPTTPGQPAITAPNSYQDNANTTAIWTDILPGSHTFGAQLVNNDHTPLTPPVTAMVTVTAVPGLLKVVGHFDFNVGPGYTTDLWAHATADGQSYAYLGSSDEPRCGDDITGVHIIDITDPVNPVKAGFIASPAGTRVNDVAVENIRTPYFDGDILIYTIENCTNSPVPPAGSGIFLFDVTDPLKRRFLAGSFLDFQVHNVFIYQQNDRAFVLVVQDGAQRDFHIVEITNPSAPQEISVLGAVDWFDPATDELALGEVPISFLHGVWAKVYPVDFPDATLAGRTIAYLSYWDAGLILLDITDPANPVFLGDNDYLSPDPLSGQPPEGNSHSAVPTADGKLVFMADEDFSPTRTVFTVDTGNFTGEYPAAAGTFTVPVTSLPGKKLSGPTTFVGIACDVTSIPPANIEGLKPGETPLALIERDVCPFDTKIANAAAAGYGGAVVFSDAEAPEQIVRMAGDPAKGIIPAVFVSRSTAFAMLGIAPDSPNDTPLPPIGAVGNHVSFDANVFDGWGYARILDVSDPTDIKELGQYASTGAFTNPPPLGDYTIHDPVVENRRAYISWYWDGIRVVDFSDPTKPVEIAFFIDEADHSNFWGVYLYKHPDGNTYVLGSDRDSGLWILNTP